MSDATDTLSRVAIELSSLFEPLVADVVPPRTQSFFAELGIPLTAAQAAALGTPLNAIGTHVGELIAMIAPLITAIEAEDWSTVAEDGLGATVKVGQIISAFEDLATAAQGLTVPSAAKLAERIFNYLLARYLDAIHGLNDVLEFIGLLGRQDFNIGSTDPANPPYTLSTYNFGAIGDWLSDPAAKAVSLYGWGPGFDGTLLFPKLETLAAFAGLPVDYDTTTPPHLDVVLLELAPTTSGVAGLSIGLKSDFSTGTITIPLGTDANIEINAEFDVPTGMQLVVGTDASISFTPPTVTTLSGAVGIKLILKRDPPEPFVLFGQAGGSRIEFGDFTLAALANLAMNGGSATGDLDVSGTLNGGKVVIDATSGRRVPHADPARHARRGRLLAGAGRLEPARLLLQRLERARDPPADAHRARPGLDRGPHDRGRARERPDPAERRRRHQGAARPDRGGRPEHGRHRHALVPAAEPRQPRAGPARHRLQAAERRRAERLGRADHGGGFLGLDPAKGEYFGALELSFEGVISLKAVGIINTKLPDGSNGFALLILVTAEFTPIQLGFGFTLIGVGGLLGLNRSLDTEALRQGVRTGSITSILFPPDVVGNITKIISDLEVVLPDRAGALRGRADGQARLGHAAR